MKLSTVFSILLIFISFNAYSKNTQPEYIPGIYTIGAAAGINDLHIQDQYLTNKIVGGTMFSAGISFSVKTGLGVHEVEGFYTSGKPDFIDASWNTDENSGWLGYSYTHHLESFELMGNNLNVFAGGGVSSFVTSTELRKNYPSGTGTLFFDQSWYWSHNLDFKLRGEYSSGSHNVLVRVGMPVFKIAARPEKGHFLSAGNHEVIHDNFLKAALKGKPEFFWDNLVLNFHLQYAFALTGYLDLQAQYLFSYTSSDEPEMLSMGMYMNNFLIGFGFNF